MSVEMTSRRQERVGELLHEEISLLLQWESRDPRLSQVTVTDVEVSADLQSARVFVTVLGEESQQRAALQALAHATGYLHRELSARLQLRRVPRLTFELDQSVARGARILELLTHLEDQSAPSVQIGQPGGAGSETAAATGEGADVPETHDQPR